MASNFPSSLDTFTNPSSSDAMDSVSVPHATQHSDLNDAVEALQAKVGADSSAVTSSLDYKVAQLEAISHGKILQVVSTTKTDTFTTSSGTFVDVTGLSVTLTPSDSANKVLLMASVNMSVDSGSFVSRINGGNAATNYLADTATPQQSSSGFGPKTTTQTFEQSLIAQPFLYLDSPATTSSTTYTIQIRGDQAGRNLYVNRSSSDLNATYVRGASTITAFEVSA